MQQPLRPTIDTEISLKLPWSRTAHATYYRLYEPGFCDTVRHFIRVVRLLNTAGCVFIPAEVVDYILGVLAPPRRSWNSAVDSAEGPRIREGVVAWPANEPFIVLTENRIFDGSNIAIWSRFEHESILIRSSETHSNSIRSLAVSDDGNIIVSGSDDGTVKIWASSTASLLHTCRGHSGGVREVAISQALVVSSSFDSTIKMWDLSSGKLLRSVRHCVVHNMAVAHDGSVVFVPGDRDDSLCFLDAGTDGTICFVQTDTSIVAVACMKLGDTQCVVAGSEYGTIEVWNMASGAVLHTMEPPSTNGAWFTGRVCASADGCFLAALSDAEIVVWDVLAGRIRVRHRSGSMSRETRIFFGRNGLQLFHLVHVMPTAWPCKIPPFQLRVLRSASVH